MNDTMKAICSRRSAKSYISKEISENDLRQILNAGMYAPTGRNRQSPIMIAITDKATRNRLSALNASILGSSSDPFYGAPVVIVVLADKRIGTYMYDGSLVMGNLMLAAHSLGISSCWIHRAKEEFESDEGKDILRALGIPEEDINYYEGIGNCILGYQAEPPKEASPRKDNYIYYIK